MTPEQFAYWLQGFFELENPQQLNKQQLDVVKEHLALVFIKVTPKYHGTEKTYSNPDGVEKQHLKTPLVFDNKNESTQFFC